MRVTEIEEIARKDVDVLREIFNQDGGSGVTVGDVKRVLGWAEENHHVTYRYDKLEDAGFIETEKDPSRGPSNQLPPRVARVTEDGEKLVEEVEYDLEDKAIADRVKRLEKEFKPIKETYGEIKKRISDLEKDIQGHDEDLDDLAEEVEDIKRVMESNEEKGLASELQFGDD